MEKMVNEDVFGGIYKNKTVLITGHTGFKGSWLAIWLHKLGANVVGYALDPITVKDNFVLSGIENKIVDIRADIRDKEKLHKVFSTYKPDVVFHLAAQPLVLQSYLEPLDTYQVNVMGTINVLEEIRALATACVGIFITTDKCYENKEQIWGYRESDAMGGYDPYSSSKAAAEIAIASWRNSFFNPLKYNEHNKSIASVRAGNVIGGGDWSKDRIIPDCIRAFELGQSINIRNPHAIRPWQHVIEPLYGYLLLGKKIVENRNEFCEAWNFGPSNNSIVSVKELADKIIQYYGSGSISTPNYSNALHEANLLLLDINKANFQLGWKPVLSIAQVAEWTVEWYKKYTTESVYQLCSEQIEMYSKMIFSQHKSIQ